MLTLEYLWVEYEKFWFSIMCHDWLNVSGHSLLRKETSTNCTDVNAIPESSQNLSNHIITGIGRCVEFLNISSE